MNRIELASILMFILTSFTSWSQEIKREYINPTPGYTNAVAVTSGQTRTIYIAGQVGSGNIMEEQFVTSFQGVMNQLKDAKAEFSDVVKMTLYIVDYKEEHLDLISAARKQIFGTGKMPAITMMGVEALAFESMKVETEAVAVQAVND
ncbi:MAG: RidA family protein [Cyclobacteriaceae bacterium]